MSGVELLFSLFSASSDAMIRNFSAHPLLCNKKLVKTFGNSNPHLRSRFQNVFLTLEAIAFIEILSLSAPRESYKAEEVHVLDEFFSCIIHYHQN